MRKRQLSLGLLVGILTVVIFFGSGHASADCGIATNQIHDYAGLRVTSKWVGDSGNVNISNNNTVTVSEHNGSGASDSIGGNIVVMSKVQEYYVAGSRFKSQTFKQIGGCGNSMVVLPGDGTNGSPAAGSGISDWGLDCDNSKLGTDGSGNPIFQQFDVTGNGVPNGARSGGSWNVAVTASTGSNAAANGQTLDVTIWYKQPPKKPLPTGGSGTVACSDGQVTGSLASNQEIKVTIQESTSGASPNGPTLLTDTIHATDTLPTREPNGHSSPSGSTTFYYPNEQFVFITTVVATHNRDGSWSYSSPSTSGVGPCFNADCNIDSVTGDLPGGYIRAGGTVTVTATVYNDSPSGLGLPGNDIGNGIGSASDALSIQSGGGGVNGGFSNLSPPYTGPIAYPYTSDTSVTQTFNTTVSGDGNINAYAGYPGGILNLPGGICSYAVSVYHPPTVSVGAACQSSIYGTAADIYYSPPIQINIYADGPAGSGQQIDGGNLWTDNSGNYSLAMPSKYQDGQNHTFYAYAKDLYGVEDGGPATTGMTGCESFHLQPGANGGKLSPAPEAPTSFDGNATVNMTYLNGATGATSSTYNYSTFPGVPASVTYTFTKNGASVGSGSVPSPTGNGRFNDTTYTPPAVAISPATYVAGDTYCLNVGGLYAGETPIDGFVQNDGTILSVSNYGPDTKSSCDTVTNRPFFKVYNGGAAAGGAFSAITGSCSGGGTLASWNNDSGVYPTVTGGDFGASAQLNALALKDITGFASGQPPFTGQPPSYLSFANTTASKTPDAYSPKLGGDFDPTGNGYCLTDTSPPTGPTLYNGPGPYTQPGMTLNPGTNTSTFVKAAPNGDVYISGNIVYKGDPPSLTGAGASWSNMSDVPSFVLHAAGNIYISPNVTELDGLYIAQGKIYTCSDDVDGKPFKPMPTSQLGNNNNMFTKCNNQLTVYGKFVATQVNLMRTFGSLRDETPVSSVPAASDTKNGADALAAGNSCGPIPPSWGTIACTADGTSVLNYQEYAATYSLALPAGGNYSLRLNYQNYQGGWPPTGLSPPYNYDVEVDVNGIQRGSDLSLPATGGSFSVGLGALPANPSITLKWHNNSYGGCYGFIYGDLSTCSNPLYDPNFEINWLNVSSPASTATAHVASPCSNPGFQSSPQTCAAEVFDFSPEMYLPTLDTLPPGGVSAKWDTVTSLPPVL